MPIRRHANTWTNYDPEYYLPNGYSYLVSDFESPFLTWWCQTLWQAICHAYMSQHLTNQAVWHIRYHKLEVMCLPHYDDVRMGAIASQITSLAIVYSAFYSGVDQRKHQSSASLAFVWGIHRDRWIPRTKGQLRGKCFHLMTSSCIIVAHSIGAVTHPKVYTNADLILK